MHKSHTHTRNEITTPLVGTAKSHAYIIRGLQMFLSFVFFERNLMQDDVLFAVPGSAAFPCCEGECEENSIILWVWGCQEMNGAMQGCVLCSIISCFVSSVINSTCWSYYSVPDILLKVLTDAEHLTCVCIVLKTLNIFRKLHRKISWHGLSSCGIMPTFSGLFISFTIWWFKENFLNHVFRDHMISH